jgi:hypothetical protein
MSIVAERFSPSQSACAGGLGSPQPAAGPVDSCPPRSAPLSRQALRRHSSSVRAVCVDAHVRICAGGRPAMVVPTATVDPVFGDHSRRRVASNYRLAGCAGKMGAVKPPCRRRERWALPWWPKGRDAHFLSSGWTLVNTTAPEDRMEARQLPGGASFGSQTRGWLIRALFPPAAFLRRPGSVAWRLVQYLTQQTASPRKDK